MEQIKGFRQYSITTDGVIYRTTGGRKPGQPIKQSFHVCKGKEYPNGYNYVSLLSKDGKDINGAEIDIPWYYSCSVHRLVALQYIPNPLNLPEVNHIDGNKQNNHYSNLQWATHSANIKHSYEVLGREIKTGSGHWRFGKKSNLATKYKMSLAKQGKKHPKYKGFYVVNGSKYYSSKEAEVKTGLNQKTIIRWCKANKPGFCFVPDVNKEF